MIITLENVTKSYDRTVLDGINYTFRTGKLYVVKGISGCGKSTLLNIIGGVQTEYGGKIYSDVSEGFSCSYIYQKSLLVGSLTVKDNLKLVCPNDETIEKAADMTGISPLLSRSPSELSGGERQRASVTRAILKPFDVLLADEPTASLDAVNSACISEILKCISESKIVIVATHEDCFDKLADEIIYLDYGKISSVKKAVEETESEPTAEKTGINVEKVREGISPLSYAFRRKNKASFRRIIPLAIVFSLLFIAAAISDNFRGEYEKYAVGRNVTDVVITTAEKFEIVRQRYDVRVYYNVSDCENGVLFLPLFDKKDSIFALPDMIKNGSFPSTANQVIVSAAYAEAFPETIISSPITYRGKQFVISGILYPTDPSPVEGRNEKFVSFYRLNPFYRETLAEPAVLIMYDELASMNQTEHTDPYEKVAFSYPNLLNSKTVLEEIRNITGNVNQFYKDMADLQTTVQNVSLLLFAVYIICFAVSCVFIKSNVSLELYLRRKELGYLQIFGVRKSWLTRAVFYEYIASFMTSAFFGIVVCFAASTVYSSVVCRAVFVSPASVLAICLGTLIVYMPTVALSIRKCFNTPVIDLIGTVF